MGINLGNLEQNSVSLQDELKGAGAAPAQPAAPVPPAPTPAPQPVVPPTPVAPPPVDPTPAPAPAPTAPAGLCLNLQKNDLLDLTKRNPGLRNIKLGAGWDVAQTGTAFDLDIAAFMLNANGKITGAQDIVFFNNKTVPGVQLMEDNRTGLGEGDDETIMIDLAMVPPTVSRIAFCITIFDAVNRRQTFGMVNNSYVRVLDAANGDKQLCIYPLKEQYAVDTAVIVAELVRNGADWEFKALGEGKQGDLNALAAMYF